MQRAIALQAQAERERRAKIIGSEGEYQAAQKLSDAADIMSRNPATMQLRYLQTLLQIGVNNTTIVFPLPIDLMDAFKRIGEGGRTAPTCPRGRRPSVTPEPGTRGLRSRRRYRSRSERARDRRGRGPGRDPDRPADRPAGAARAGSQRPPPRLRRGRGRAGRRRGRELSRSARAASSGRRRRSGRIARAAASRRPGLAAAVGPEPLPGAHGPRRDPARRRARSASPG